MLNNISPPKIVSGSCDFINKSAGSAVEHHSSSGQILNVRVASQIDTINQSIGENNSSIFEHTRDSADITRIGGVETSIKKQQNNFEGDLTDLTFRGQEILINSTQQSFEKQFGQTQIQITDQMQAEAKQDMNNALRNHLFLKKMRAKSQEGGQRNKLLQNHRNLQKKFQLGIIPVQSIGQSTLKNTNDVLDLGIWTTGIDSQEKQRFPTHISINPFHNSLRSPKEAKPIIATDSDGFNIHKFQFMAHDLTRPQLMELKLKSEQPRNKVIQEVVYLAILLKDTQEYVQRPSICFLEQNKVLANHGLKLLLTSLDPQRIPESLAKNILSKLYSDQRYFPNHLQNICQGLYHSVKHIEAVLQKSIFLAKQKNEQISQTIMQTAPPNFKKMETMTFDPIAFQKRKASQPMNHRTLDPLINDTSLIRRQAQKFSLGKAQELLQHNPDLAGAAIEGYRQSMIEKYKRGPINLQLANKSQMSQIERPARRFNRIQKIENENTQHQRVIQIVVQNQAVRTNQQFQTIDKTKFDGFSAEPTHIQSDGSLRKIAYKEYEKVQQSEEFEPRLSIQDDPIREVQTATEIKDKDELDEKNQEPVIKLTEPDDLPCKSTGKLQKGKKKKINQSSPGIRNSSKSNSRSKKKAPKDKSKSSQSKNVSDSFKIEAQQTISEDAPVNQLSNLDQQAYIDQNTSMPNSPHIRSPPETVVQTQNDKVTVISSELLSSPEPSKLEHSSMSPSKFGSNYLRSSKDAEKRAEASRKRQETIMKARQQVESQNKALAATQSIVESNKMDKDGMKQMEKVIKEVQEKIIKEAEAEAKRQKKLNKLKRLAEKQEKKNRERSQAGSCKTSGKDDIHSPAKSHRSGLEWTQNATQAGKELPKRPLKKEIWNNRKLNLKNFDRMYYDGWRYMPNKFLDLHPQGDLKTLEPLPERPQLVKYVNLTDELPDGIRDKIPKQDQEETDPNKDYDIKEMWRRLNEEEPSAVADAQQFNYKTHSSMVDKFSDRTSPRTVAGLHMISDNAGMTRVVPTQRRGSELSENSPSVTTVKELLVGPNQSPRFKFSQIQSRLGQI